MPQSVVVDSVLIDEQVSVQNGNDSDIAIVLVRKMKNNKRSKGHSNEPIIAAVVKKEIPSSSSMSIVRKIQKRARRVSKKNSHVVRSYKGEMLICDECGYEANYRCHLVVHIFAVHLKIRSYKCKLCNKTFPYQRSRKAHLKRIHLNEKPFICDQCQMAFGTRYEVHSHWTYRHCRKRHFKCHLCDKKFKLANKLNQHKKSMIHRNRELSKNLHGQV